MSRSTLVETIKETLKSYYAYLEKFEGDQILDLWYHDGKMYNVGNANAFLIRTPQEFAHHMTQIGQTQDIPLKIKIDKIDHVAVHDLIASAEVHWRMILPDSVGIHRSCYHLAKMDSRWVIVSLMDRGLEIAEN